MVLELSECDFQRNVRRFIVFRFLRGMLIIAPVLTPYLLLQGLSYAQIMLLQSISAVAVVVFEIPTGAVADKLSRRWALVLGTACMVAGLFIYIQGHDFYTFALAEVVFALGLTLGSGADGALLYESLAHLQRQGEYARIEARAWSYMFIGQGVGAVFSSLVYTVAPTLPFWISLACLALAGLAALGFSETQRTKSQARYYRHIIQGLQWTLGRASLQWTLCLAVWMGFAYRTAFWLYQPYFAQVDIEVAWYGAIFCFYNIVAALAARYLIHQVDVSARNLLGLGVFMGVSYLLPVLWVFPGGVAVIGLQQIVRGLYRPMLGAFVNSQAQDSHRATVLSIVNLAASLGFALLSPLVGIGLDQRGAVETYVWMGLATLGGMGLLGVWAWLQRGRRDGALDVGAGQ